MSITQRCNYAGTLGHPIHTRSFVRSLFARLRDMTAVLSKIRN